MRTRGRNYPQPACFVRRYAALSNELVSSPPRTKLVGDWNL
mgnify:CR=1 FL=1